MLARCSTSFVLLALVYGLSIFLLTSLLLQPHKSCTNPVGSIALPIFSQIYSQDSAGKIYEPDEYTLQVRQRLNDLKGLVLPVNATHARPFLRIKSYYRIAPRYNLASCIIEKAMCTLTQSIFCYLYDSEGFVKNNRSIATESWDKRFCEKRNEMSNTQEKRLLMPFKPPTVFIVREPVERFLSGFIDKCINENSTCYGCKGDIFCAVEGFHAEIMKMNVKHWDVTIPKTSYISQSYETQHMAPSNWMCDLFEESDNYIYIKYGENREALEAMYDNIMGLFKAQGVEGDKIHHIMKTITQRTQHATKSSAIREEYSGKLRSSKRHTDLLNDVYRYDYKVFGYDPL